MTTNEPQAPVLCSVCGDPRDDHSRVHRFTAPGTDVDSSFLRPTKRAEQQVVASVDLVLRQALLDRGILTADDVLAAETKIEMIASLNNALFGKVRTDDDS